MSFFIRKSFRLGPVRLNLSKGGIGFSTGVTGARLGVTSRGRPYMHAGRGGLYTRRYLDTPAEAKPHRVPTGTVTLYEDTGVTFPAGHQDLDRSTIRELATTHREGATWPYVLLAASSLPLFALAVGAAVTPLRIILLGLGLAALATGTALGSRVLRRQRAREALRGALIRNIAGASPLTRDALVEIEATLGDPALTAADRTSELHRGYQLAARRIVDDGYVTPQELELLEQLESVYDLDPAGCAVTRVDAFRSIYFRAIADHVLTEEEERSLDQLRSALRIPREAITGELATIGQLADLRRIQDGELPIIETEHPLRAGERCHFERPVRLLRERNLRTFQRDGQRYRVRGLVVEREGTLLVTDRRIVILHTGETSIPLGRVVTVEVDLDRNLLHIARNDVKNPTLLSTPNAEKAGAIISKAAMP